ncbi:MAG: triose-phosphate isomerase [Trueperaceae bacterium]
MRTPLIAGNWKLHTTPSQAVTWARAFLEDLAASPVPGVELALHVPFTHLAPLAPVLRGTAVALGAQDVSAHADGAHTGEVSAAMLEDVGARLVVVGHSERRADHHESDPVVRAKAAAAMGAGLVPVVCVGEVESERAAGHHEDVVVAQLRGSLADLPVDAATDLVVAYEPVWAIGTGRTATADDAQAMSAVVREVLRELFGDVGDDVRVLYGGSMKPGNAAELLAMPDVDGGLVGGASLDRASLLAIAQAAVG